MVLGIGIIEEVAIGSRSIPVSASFQLIIEVLVIVLGLAFAHVRLRVSALASEWETVASVLVSEFYLKLNQCLRIDLVLCGLGIAICKWSE